MRLVVCVAVVAGCYSPRPPDGAPCGPGRACPTGQSCSLIDDHCYYDEPGSIDAKITGDGPLTPDGTPATTCTPRRLLTGGIDIAQQGWTIVSAGGGTITYGGGATTLSTTNNARQLIVLRNAFPSTRWQIEIVAQIVSSGGHTANNAAAALMSSFHDPVGDDQDRQRMLFLDDADIGWGVGNPVIGAETKKMGIYRFERLVNGASVGVKATVLINGSTALSASPFTSNGTIAIGDQTTEPGLDSTLKVYSVDLMCP